MNDPSSKRYNPFLEKTNNPFIDSDTVAYTKKNAMMKNAKNRFTSDFTGNCSRKLLMYCGAIILVSIILMFILFFITKSIYSKDTTEDKRMAAAQNKRMHTQDQVRKAEIARLQKLLTECRSGMSGRSAMATKRIMTTPQRLM